MKVTNHNKNNCIYTKDCVVRGTITMSEQEFYQVEKYLKARYIKAVKDCETSIRDGLKYTKLLPKSKKVVMGVTATRLIFEKFNLPRYKEVNYLWEIK